MFRLEIPKPKFRIQLTLGSDELKEQETIKEDIKVEETPEKD